MKAHTSCSISTSPITRHASIALDGHVRWRLPATRSMSPSPVESVSLMPADSASRQPGNDRLSVLELVHTEDDVRNAVSVASLEQRLDDLSLRADQHVG